MFLLTDSTNTSDAGRCNVVCDVMAMVINNQDNVSSDFNDKLDAGINQQEIRSRVTGASESTGSLSLHWRFQQ